MTKARLYVDLLVKMKEFMPGKVKRRF